MSDPDRSATDFPYLHGFSATEQARLVKQARLAESTIFRNIDYTGARRLLEVGSGVGAQTEILLRRFPDLHATCVDLNDVQIEAARANLGAMPWLEGRYAIQQADATDLPFEPRSFDAAFLCWVLEHVPSPARVLSEVRRVLSPGSVVYVTEVMNASFLLDPYSPNVWRYGWRSTTSRSTVAATPSWAPSSANCCWRAATGTSPPRSRPSTSTTASRRGARR